MLYSSSDKANLSRWLREENEQLDLEILRGVYKIIAWKLGRERRGIIPINEILAGSYATFPPPDEGIIRVALAVLESAGLLERSFDLPMAARLSLPLSSLGSTLPFELISFIQTVGLDGSDAVKIDLVPLASRLGISPPELDKWLLNWHEAGLLNYQVARREYYLELKDAGSDVRTKLENLLEQRRTQSRESP